MALPNVVVPAPVISAVPCRVRVEVAIIVRPAPTVRDLAVSMVEVDIVRSLFITEYVPEILKLCRV